MIEALAPSLRGLVPAAVDMSVISRQSATVTPQPSG